LNEEIAFVILIGGKSKRFGNDKGLTVILGKSFIQHQLETLKRISKNIFLSARDEKQILHYNEEIQSFDASSFIIDERDIIKDKSFRSPLIGMYSIFKKLSSSNFSKVFLISCDLPLIKREIVELMLKESQEYDCCIPIWNNGYLEPLFAIYPIRKGCTESKKNLEGSKFRLREILSKDWKINYISIENKIKPFDKELLSFYNINTEEHLENLKNLLAETQK
jgi:molybdopterin-guanine dinucleotide biosynthesis protein A